jgi:signal transduction histidine kinase
MSADDGRRLEALHNVGLPDTLPDAGFDRITRLACSLARVPIALICFVEAKRHRFLSTQGLDAIDTHRAISFCSHAIRQEDALIVPDTRQDTRFTDNPLVTGAPFGRFYAGFPIHARGGARVGTLCVMDTEPRQLSAQELGALGDLAVLVDTQLSAMRFQRECGLQQKLRESSHQAGMAEIATGVLHSVGNVVNSLGIANATIRRDIKALRLEQLEQATALIRANRASLASYLTDDARGRNLPDYMPALSAQICAKVQAVQAELDTVDTLLEHLRTIVSAQQMRAHVGSHREPVDLKELLDATLLAQALELSHIQVLRSYEDLPLVTTDRHKVLLILANLLNNARDAVLASVTQPGRIAVHLGREEDHALISIEDSGIGMSADILSRLWRFGFTTKPNGLGFDLHNSANAAREIGATIAAHSDGPNKGSRFVLRLPISL